MTSNPHKPGNLLPLQPLGNSCPLYLCYSVGGECLQYQALVRNLGVAQPVYGFQPREASSQPKRYEHLQEIAADCVEDLCHHQPDGPYCLGGFSFGGLVAYEMARLLRDRGQEVALLAIIDVGPAWHPPQTLRELLLATPAAIWNFPRWLIGMLTDWRGFPLRRKVRQRIRRIRKLLTARMVWDSRSAVRPATEDFFEVDKLNERSRRLIPILFDAYLRYQPGVYGGRVSLFRARTWPLIQLPRHDLGWGRYASGRVDVEVIPGGHSSILTEPYVMALATALRRKLEMMSRPAQPTHDYITSDRDATH
ncbi:MAG TPA: thioesterase domain-containing protein [Pirellulales bacterium]|jgi:thioesterase domain-containing protein